MNIVPWRGCAVSIFGGLVLCSLALGWQHVPTTALSGKRCQLWWMQSLERPWLSAEWIPLLPGRAGRASVPSCMLSLANCHTTPLLMRHTLLACPACWCSLRASFIHAGEGLATVAPDPAENLSATAVWAVGSWELSASQLWKSSLCTFFQLWRTIFLWPAYWPATHAMNCIKVSSSAMAWPLMKNDTDNWSLWLA